MDIAHARGRRGSHHWAAKCKLGFAKEFGEKGIPLQESADEAGRKELLALESFFGMEEGDARETVDKGIVAFAATAFSATTKPSVSPEAAALNVKGMLWKKIHERRTTVAVAEPTSQPSSPRTSEASPQASLGARAVLGHPGGAPPSSSRSAMKVMAPGTERESLKSAPAREPWIQGSRSGGDGRNDPLQLADASSPDHEIESCSESARFAQSAKDRIHAPVTVRELIGARPPEPLAMGDFPPLFQRNLDRPQESHYSYFSRRIPEESPELRRVMRLRATHTQRLRDEPPPPRLPTLVRFRSEGCEPGEPGEGRGLSALLSARARAGTDPGDLARRAEPCRKDAGASRSPRSPARPSQDTSPRLLVVPPSQPPPDDAGRRPSRQMRTRSPNASARQ
mmetsp:Transcript_64927/g.193541  ORF Transcript_64927/g.193541 Transcript_64927/m.193541 type:complete len:396 (-) Transcript_64927:161-1348(-)